MSRSIRTGIYKSTKKLGLSASDIDSYMNRKIPDSKKTGNSSSYKAGTWYGTVGAKDIYKAGTHYGTVSAKDIYKAGTMYGAVSPKDFE